MTIAKAHWATEGDNVRLSMPFSKVDVERRIVSGFATLDNVDKQSDIVTSEASMNAFAKFRGNIREMHQPVAVGKMISFKEDKFFDPESKKFYAGVYVSTYISKGAQDAWEKVLDGTYTGFSIGGKMNKWDDAYDEKMESKIRIIKEYDLVELSLVDNPANQFASILSVQKIDGVDTVQGANSDTVIENVFWDAESGMVLLSENDSEVSPTSGAEMQNIGFVEKTDTEKPEMIKFLVDSAKGINTSKIIKEVSPMTDTTENVEAEAPVADAPAVEESQVAPEADAAVEKSDVVAEKGSGYDKSEDMEEDAKKSDDMDEDDDEEDKKEDMLPKSDSASETEAVSKSEDAVVAAVAEIKDGITSAFSDLTSVVKSLGDEVAELKKSLGLANAKLADAENDFNEFGKRVDAVEADTAFRKSGDLGEIVQNQPETVEKSLWGGRFLKTADLFR
jgi:hypothetical protein